MEMTVQGKRIDVGDALREHVTEKLSDIDQKYFNHGTAATVTFSKEGHGHGLFKVNISFNVNKNIMVVTEATEPDPYAAFDSASEKAAKRLRRYKRKLRDHHGRRDKTPEEEMMKARDYTLAIQAQEEVIEQDNQEETEAHDDPAIIAEGLTHIEKMSVADAVMRMELADLNAWMFRNASNNKLSMVYVRKDGNVGWIEPDEQ
ncbi:MAG: ribosome-associated translation inhibitor RaiA [Alphaproteobacteria bacterium]|nr:ribosome-associated translation inhibitor RaiA [Alphaproteobacteria bacterium]